ncbi:hypothetical protein [Pseudomonas typographi]|uniref:Transposase n=1 Tax=Pseudomonas typographi TaxID=2715964 RepID=A0ABR7YZK2_9PSED|nr:hypothetical protein [Pseudomonas typographi]MBD1586714.1 hypothetical protein [Pseudomonas typographi]MBD1598607.1 hypothetical protein [Pseudomonas typographi]
MKPRHIKAQLQSLIIELSILHAQAHLVVKRRRGELNHEYERYFAIHGEVEPGFRGIKPHDERYAGVVAFTDEAYGRLCKAKQRRYSAKRRLDLAIRRLMILTGASFAVPDEAPAKRPQLKAVRRVNARGVTLQ